MDEVELVSVLQIVTGEVKSVEPGKIYRISPFPRGELHATKVRWTNGSLEMWIENEYIGWVSIASIKSISTLLRGK